MGIVTEAIAIHTTVGGNLSDILAQVAETMREREELVRHVRSLTAQERASSVIVAMLPIWVGGTFYFTDPDFIEPLVGTTIGLALLAGALALEAAGFLLMRKVMKIEV